QAQKPRQGENPNVKIPTEVWTTAFSNDSKYLAALTKKGCMTVWNLETGKEEKVFRFDDPFGLFSGYGGIAWVGDHDAIIAPAVTQVGGYMYCSIKTGKAEAIRMSGPEEPEGPGDVSVFAVSRDGRRLVKTHKFPDTLRAPLVVYDLAARRMIGEIRGLKGDRFWSLQFSPDSKKLAIGTQQGYILIEDLPVWEEMARKGAVVEFAK
ncbi:MAG: WD40 repeat domain-containing protein, partial [Verrucomicrobiota bacterium]